MPDQTACSQPATGFVYVLCACSRLAGNKVLPTLERLRVRNSNAGSNRSKLIFTKAFQVASFYAVISDKRIVLMYL